MAKATSLFLRSLMRVGNKPQRSIARAIGSLLAPPKPKPKRKATASTSAAGKWLVLHFAGYSGGNPAHVRRMRYFPGPAPAPTRAAPGLSLIAMLHGCEQSAASFAEGTRMNQLAETAGCAVVCPEQALASHPHRCWKWYDRNTQQGGGDVPLIVGIIEHVSAAYPIDRSRICICGISAVAGMTNVVALNHPGLFVALGLRSGVAFNSGRGPQASKMRLDVFSRHRRSA